jgi:UDP-N-acetylglucosamine diphosphorylase / glucose-1-phosphate thymidylyltransferase / UDP-N-acetylgalactosamine diphosphorylase / glucosamine-1-phosphate N-acetyltransferase / galactosamine-1-phosphate N-acetyltransferase
MQAVILAAGRGTRMGTLTDSTPKPMLKIGEKNLIEYKVDILPESIDEVILVVGYLGNVIREYFGTEYNGKKITYVEQKNIVGGTADALWQAREILKDRFIVMMGDDLYAQKDVEECLKKEWALLVDKVHGKRSSGRVITNESGNVVDVVEGQHDEEGWLTSTNMFVLDTRIFNQAPVPKATDSTELGLPQTVLAAARTQHVSFSPVLATFWFQVSGPVDLAIGETVLRKANT